jgi:hypothetical protein
MRMKEDTRMLRKIRMKVVRKRMEKVKSDVDERDDNVSNGKRERE